MKIKALLAAMGAVGALAACQTDLDEGVSLSTYCADADAANEAVCRLKTEFDAQGDALQSTQASVGEVRDAAEAAGAAASAAQTTADQALSMARAAQNQSTAMSCETRTVQQSTTGACEAGETLMSCVQTRYTFRAGGKSIIREVNDQQCRFHDQVLEMQLRCCTLSETG